MDSFERRDTDGGRLSVVITHGSAAQPDARIDLSYVAAPSEHPRFRSSSWQADSTPATAENKAVWRAFEGNPSSLPIFARSESLRGLPAPTRAMISERFSASLPPLVLAALTGDGGTEKA